MVSYFHYKTTTLGFLVGLKDNAVCFVGCISDFKIDALKLLKKDFPGEAIVQVTAPVGFDLYKLSDKDLVLCGTPFQIRVWRALLQIPIGKVVSYQELSVRAGFGNNYARAVAGAVAKNKIAVLVPCHRVIRKSGSLCGFRWGAEIKKLLLEAESAL